MKVAYLIGSLNRGGAETLLLDIFRKSESAPFGMILIHRKGGLYENDFENEKPHCYRVAPRKWHFCAYLRQLRKTFIDEHVTIIHAFYWLEVIFAKLATIGLNIPIVITFHGYLGGEAGLLDGMLYRLVMRIAKRLFFVSEEQKSRFAKRYGYVVSKKGMVLYNGLNFDKFEFANEGVGEITKEHNIKLCMVGNFNRVRSQIIVVKALRILSRNVTWNNIIEFYFIGGRISGEEHYYDECVAFCEEYGLNNVHFMGVRDDVPALLKTMDGFVYSSRNDTFGIAAIEAIACGLPMVVNDHPVMKEVCSLHTDEANMAVRFYLSEDAEECANKIANLLEDMQLRPKQLQIDCHLASEYVRNKYSITTHITNLENIYLSL